jgi:hypothetical protein
VYQSWAIAVRKRNVGTPKFKTDSSAETDELEKFSIQLRFDDFSQTLKQYSSLIERRKYDKDFVHWMGKIIQLRGKPDRTKLSLRYYLLLLWLHGFLWCINPLNRPEVIFLGFAIPIERVTPEAIRKTAARMGLKSCANFRQTYPQAPVKFIFSKTEQSFCFDFPATGQKFPLPKED